jgi:hypothetical protein
VCGRREGAQIILVALQKLTRERLTLHLASPSAQFAE